jgi:hypothetical protein
MATIQTGRTLSVEIDSVVYSAQVAEVQLVPNETVDQYVTLTDTVAVRQPTTWQLTLRAYQDWGEAGSFCDAMWAAAAAGALVPFELGLAGPARCPATSSRPTRPLADPPTASSK